MKLNVGGQKNGDQKWIKKTNAIKWKEMKLQEKQIINKSIKHVNRAIKNRGTKPDKKN
jgi:hypothetical protein